LFEDGECTMTSPATADERKALADACREAFDSESVSLKNIVLRKAHDALRGSEPDSLAMKLQKLCEEFGCPIGVSRGTSTMTDHLYKLLYGLLALETQCRHALTPQAPGHLTREEAIEECARHLKSLYPDHAAINAYCAAIRSLALNQLPVEVRCDIKWTEWEGAVYTDQPIFDAIAAATQIDSEPDGFPRIVMSAAKFIETFNSHRDRALCSSLALHPLPGKEEVPVAWIDAAALQAAHEIVALSESWTYTQRKAAIQVIVAREMTRARQPAPAEGVREAWEAVENIMRRVNDAIDRLNAGLPPNSPMHPVAAKLLGIPIECAAISHALQPLAAPAEGVREALEQAVSFARQVEMMDAIRDIPGCAKIAAEYRAKFEAALRSQPKPEAAGDAGI
jgi:hypothetical protein